MGWNIQTWLWSTVILCGLVVWVYEITVVRVEHNKTLMNEPPHEFQVQILETRVRRLHQLRRICGVLALFCILTVVLFG